MTDQSNYCEKPLAQWLSDGVSDLVLLPSIRTTSTLGCNIPSLLDGDVIVHGGVNFGDVPVAATIVELSRNSLDVFDLLSADRHWHVAENRCVSLRTYRELVKFVENAETYRQGRLQLWWSHNRTGYPAWLQTKLDEFVLLPPNEFVAELVSYSVEGAMLLIGFSLLPQLWPLYTSAAELAGSSVAVSEAAGGFAGLWYGGTFTPRLGGITADALLSVFSERARELLLQRVAAYSLRDGLLDVGGIVLAQALERGLQTDLAHGWIVDKMTQLIKWFGPNQTSYASDLATRTLLKEYKHVT